MKKTVLFISACVLVLSLTQTVFAIDDYVKIILNGRAVNLSKAPRLVKNRVLLPVRDMAEMMQLDVSWNQRKKEVTFIHPEKKLVLSVAQQSVMTKNETYHLDIPVSIIDQRVYVPMRFVSEWFGADVQWQQASRSVEIQHDPKYILSGDRSTNVWVHLPDSSFYQGTKGMKPQFIGKIKGEIQNESDMTVEQITDTLLCVQIKNESLAQMNFSTKLHTVYIKDHEIIHEAQISYHGIFPFRHIDKTEDHWVLSDGKTLQLLNREGEIEHHYDLNKLTGMEGRFLLEQIDREYLLVRPYKNPYMVFINLNKNTSTPLYTRLLPEQDQEYIKNMTQGNADPEFIPHVLYFKKREGSKLYFDYQSYFKEEPQTLVYEME